MSKTKMQFGNEKKKTEFVVKTNVSVLCLYLSLELKEMIRKRKEKKLVKSKRKVSCFGCHFKIKNFTMSTCLLLLYCYVPQSMIKIISWNRFHGKTCRGKNFYPPTHTLIMPPIVYCRPLPLIVAMSDLRIYASEKNYLFRCKNTRKYFPLQNSHVEHICLVVEPP